MDAIRKPFSNSDRKEPRPKQKRRKHFKNRMHLWEFPLELLYDHQYRSFITWTRRQEGEFRIIQTEEVAKLWGLEKGRQGMTYEKLSRALRQYYTERIIAKVKGQEKTYKFDKLPYDYYPGVTRSRKSVHRGNPTKMLLSEVGKNEYKTRGYKSSSLSIYPATFVTSHANSPENIIEHNGSRHIKPSVIYPGNFPAPESPHSSSYLGIKEENVSHSIVQSLFPGHILTPKRSPLNIADQITSRLRQPSIISLRHFFRAQESSHFSSYINNIGQSATFSGSSAVMAYPPFPLCCTNDVIWPTEVNHRVHNVPYEPVVYSVSLPYDNRPVITSVVGNYLGYPTMKQ